jgi:hypothetical protein
MVPGLRIVSPSRMTMLAPASAVPVSVMTEALTVDPAVIGNDPAAMLPISGAAGGVLSTGTA